MQNAGMAALGLNWRYLAADVPPDQLREALAGLKAMRFIGVNLTVPHKLLALEMMDVLDESARLWGAVNTIRLEGMDEKGTWRSLGDFDDPPPEIRTHGFNTDADAITRALHEDLAFEPRGARILLLGAGGAGRAAALKLASEKPAALFLVNRTLSKAEAVAAEIRARHPDATVAVGYPEGPVDLVINATSLGLMPGDPLPFDASELDLRRVSCVYDMVYRPAETAFLQSAKSSGCRIANGLGMLLHQGAMALELWSGQPAPVSVMAEALRRNIYG